MVERVGFEPTKASLTDLQSVPFNLSGTSPVWAAGFEPAISWSQAKRIAAFLRPVW